MEQRISIQNIPKISAVYFALLQCGYAYYAVAKPDDVIKAVESYRMPEADFDTAFFAAVKQDTCVEYPYWPRAAVLESAVFHLTDDPVEFADFAAFHAAVMTAGNLTAAERNESFWKWMGQFPAAMTDVLKSNGFRSYLCWENDWIAQQNHLHQQELHHMGLLLDACLTAYPSPVQTISVILNPIKCAYSADYHINGPRLLYCSGAFSTESVLHEFLHPIIHPYVGMMQDIVWQRRLRYPAIDESYYLSGSRDGELNAFEEYAVRRLTKDVLAGSLPSDLACYMQEILHDSASVFHDA